MAVVWIVLGIVVVTVTYIVVKGSRKHPSWQQDHSPTLGECVS